MGNSRLTRRILFYGIATVAGVAMSVFLVWSLRSLILPIILGSVLAYLFKPLLYSFKYTWIPESIRFMLIFLLIGASAVSFYRVIKNNIPTDKEQLELMVRVQYKLNEKYKSIMGLNEAKSEAKKGNFLYDITEKEITPFLEHMNHWLVLSSSQQMEFESHYAKSTNENDIKYYSYYTANVKNFYSTHDDKQNKIDTISSSELATNNINDESFLSKLLNTLSTWLVLPFVFIFLLFDNGQILKSFVKLVPNRYFELTLTVIEEADSAIGKYLRGTLLECALVGATLAVGLIVIGLDSKVSLVIGLIAGVTNAIPFLGPAIGLIVGLSYALVAEEITPLLTFINEGNIVIGVLCAVGIAQILDNSVYQPIVLGGAVNLHPLVVIIGVMGGSIIFGFSGMLLAIPAIVITKVIVGTLFRELKAYRII